MPRWKVFQHEIYGSIFFLKITSMINSKISIKPNLEWFSDASKKHTSITVSLESCEGKWKNWKNPFFLPFFSQTREKREFYNIYERRQCGNVKSNKQGLKIDTKTDICMKLCNWLPPLRCVQCTLSWGRGPLAPNP